jgi:hypothetical protein
VKVLYTSYPVPYLLDPSPTAALATWRGRSDFRLCILNGFFPSTDDAGLSGVKQAERRSIRTSTAWSTFTTIFACVCCMASKETDCDRLEQGQHQTQNG